eukprot:TRINITY_DN34566_c0_g1_i1.p1 TRINITY_DN34566_c0_g1~~TRINITY_DN34566_c0_g1_i1.p1  ORF type:complete len:185 (-),score=26.27 TRINITY_DN34566_c0_g1_i1:465-1019(-)
MGAAQVKAVTEGCCNKSSATSAHNAQGEYSANAVSADSNVWALDFTHMLGPDGSEDINKALGIHMLDKSMHHSVTTTVDRLNANPNLAPSGICAIFSNSQQMWFLLWRQDRTEEAARILEQVNELLGGMEAAVLGAVMLSSSSGSSGQWSTEMLVELGPPGAEEAFVGSVPVLDRCRSALLREM